MTLSSTKVFFRYLPSPLPLMAFLHFKNPEVAATSRYQVSFISNIDINSIDLSSTSLFTFIHKRMGVLPDDAKISKRAPKLRKIVGFTLFHQVLPLCSFALL